MTDNLKKMYKTMAGDPFPQKMEISFTTDDKKKILIYEKATWSVAGVRKGLRYGENPGQPAALYRLINSNLVLGDVKTILPGRYLVSDIELLQSGKHPGKTNLTDTDNALNILRYMNNKPTAVIVKHNNPCGVAQDSVLERSYEKAYMADRVAAFGGCIALNRPIDKATASLISSQYAEVIVAPDFEEGAFDILASRKNLRIVKIGNMDKLENFIGEQYIDFKSLIDGGIIAQMPFVPNTRKKEDFVMPESEHNGKIYKINRKPEEKESDDMLLGWFVEAGVTSNSVIYVKNLATVGIGTGEQDRVGVAEIARNKAYRKLADRYCYETYNIPYNEIKDNELKAEIDSFVSEKKGGLIGAAMISDAFFPFRDGIDVGLNEGVTSIIQPGGSVNDYQSIQACNEVNATMVFTGQRSFKH